MSDWASIETAPRDGTVIELTAFLDDGELFEIHPMRWAHIQRNGLFPGTVGMWTSPHLGYTWNDDGFGGGPTHWRPASVDGSPEGRDPQGLDAEHDSAVTPKAADAQGGAA